MPSRVDTDCWDLRIRYEAGQSTVILARRYGCSPTTIAHHLRRCGIKLRDARFRLIKIPADELARLYTDERWRIHDIAAFFSVSTSTIRNRLHQYGIPVRPRQRAASDATDPLSMPPAG